MRSTIILYSVALVMFQNIISANGAAYRRTSPTGGNTELSKEKTTEKTSVVKIFHSIDFNKDWILTPDEIRDKLDINEKIDQFLETADQNQDRKITYSEFFDIKNKLLREFKFIKAPQNTDKVSASSSSDVSWEFIEDYGLIIGLIAMTLLIASFKFI